jgi:hypothetical protein
MNFSADRVHRNIIPYFQNTKIWNTHTPNVMVSGWCFCFMFQRSQVYVLAWSDAIPIEDFYGFHHSCQANAMMVSQIRSILLTIFSVHPHCHNVWCYKIWAELLKELFSYFTDSLYGYEREYLTVMM